MHISKVVRKFMLATGMVAGMGVSALAQAADTIKVGILHSLSGTMAISETTLKDTMLISGTSVGGDPCGARSLPPCYTRT